MMHLEKNNFIMEDDRSNLNVGVIVKERKTDHQGWLWTTL